MNSRTEKHERAAGCLLGLLAGDALGSAVEFKGANEIARLYPDGVHLLEDGGTWNLIAGQPTDDGEMALALARSLLEEKSFSPDRVTEAYIRWWQSDPFDIGMTISSSLSTLSKGRTVTTRSQANGALMRVAPIGLLHAGDVPAAARAAVEDADLTHPHPVCQAANAAFAGAIAAGIAGADAETMWLTAYEQSGSCTTSQSAIEAVRERLMAARREAPTEFQHQMGWVLTTFQNAFFHLLSAAAFEEAVIGTVGCGGDTDTNAAITGALIGAQQGVSAIPAQWREAVLSCRPDEASASVHPRPKEYWPMDALSLAKALVDVRN